MSTLAVYDPVTQTVVQVPAGTPVYPDSKVPTGWRILSAAEQEEFRLRRERGLAKTRATAIVVAGTMAAAGYWWKGWKGAVGVPVGACVLFFGVAIAFANR